MAKSKKPKGAGGEGGAGERGRSGDELPAESLKLTFRYEGDRIELVSSRRVAMLAPPSDSLGKQPPTTGFCCEVLTKRGRVLYRRFGDTPIQTSVEVPGESEDGTMMRAVVKSPKGEFTVIVPVLEKAERLSFVSDVFNEKPGPSRSIAAFSLRELPDLGEDKYNG